MGTRTAGPCLLRLIHNTVQIAPAETEDVLLSHEDVLDGAVVGTPHPTDGQLLTAIVELRPGAKVTSQQLLTYVNGKESINTRTGHETNTRTRN